MKNTDRFKLLIIIYISLGYALFGFAGDLLTDQASDASTIWPASGIALASCLIWGRSIWPGIFIGAFIINAWIGFDTTSAQSILRSTLLVSTISLGAVLQALTGHFLVIRLNSQFSLFKSISDIFLLWFLGGFLSCLISPTIGVSSLVYAGFIPLEQYISNWFTWWIGDVIGVIVFTPLTLIFFASPRDHWKPKIYSVAFPVCLTLIIVFGIYGYAYKQEQKHHALQFDSYVSNLHSSFKSKVNQYQDMLFVLKRFLEHSKIVSRLEFKNFTADTLLQLSEIKALVWISYFSNSDRQQFEQKIKNEGFIDFKIFDIQSPLEITQQQDKYAAITYIEPFDQNKKNLGLNVLSDRNVEETLSKIIKTKRASVTSGIKLIKGQNNHLGLVIYQPVYDHDRSSKTIGDTENALIGFVASVFNIENIVNVALPGLDSMNIVFELYDQSDITKPQLLYSNKPTLQSAATSIKSRLTYSQEFELTDRQWKVYFSTLPEYENKRWTTWFILSGGFFFTAILSGFLLFLSEQAGYIKQQVKGKTNDLKQTNYLLNKTNQALVSTNKKLLDSEYQFRKIVQTQPAIVWRYDLMTGCFTFVSDGAENLLGYSNEKWFEKDFWINHIHQDDRQCALSYTLQATKKHQKYDFEYRMLSFSDQTVWVKDFVNVVSKNGIVSELMGVMIDVSTERKAEEQTRLAATTFETHEGITITDANAIVLKVNKAFTRITGYTHEEAVGQHISFLKSGRHDALFYSDLWNQLIESGKYEGEVWNRRKNGEFFPEWITITAVKDNNYVITNYVGVFSDITAKKASEDEIRSLAFYDPLTNLPNRRLLLDRIQQEILETKRNHHFGAVIFLDLDRFKILNDSLGHHIGDELLIQVSERLQSVLRKNDTASRLGGDEFVVLLPLHEECAEGAADKAINVAEKIRVLLNKPYPLQNNEQTFSCSLGVAIFSRENDEASHVLQQADTAMYISKDRGKNCISFYHSSMQEAADKRLLLENELRLAIKNQQFTIFYQPQVDALGKVISAEALIRWIHPEKGLISPSEFIPIAEETSLILPIGNLVLNEVCQQINEWTLSGFKLNYIAINVSSRQFKQQDFIGIVSKAIADNGISADKLTLELTESIVADDINDTAQKMNALKALGIKISIDDFGTGYSSLSYLKQLPLDQLKIDQSFVRDISIDPDDAIIVETIINMANNLGLNVIAEGVETEEQRLFLKEKGCKTFQGYLFAHPMLANELMFFES